MWESLTRSLEIWAMKQMSRHHVSLGSLHEFTQSENLEFVEDGSFIATQLKFEEWNISTDKLLSVPDLKIHKLFSEGSASARLISDTHVMMLCLLIKFYKFIRYFTLRCGLGWDIRLFSLELTHFGFFIVHTDKEYHSFRPISIPIKWIIKICKTIGYNGLKMEILSISSFDDRSY